MVIIYSDKQQLFTSNTHVMLKSCQFDRLKSLIWMNQMPLELPQAKVVKFNAYLFTEIRDEEKTIKRKSLK